MVRAAVRSNLFAMYLRRLHVESLKLLRDLTLDFTNVDGTPRMWTVLVGENRLCKTTILQAIAAAASGTDRGTQLVGDVVASWPDLRAPQTRVTIETAFGFSETRHSERRYPTTLVGGAASPGRSPIVHGRLLLEPGARVFTGGSRYGDAHDVDAANGPVESARRQSLPDWFVAAYGPTRPLLRTGSVQRSADPVVDRLRPVFGAIPPIGTGFLDLFEAAMSRALASVLRDVFVGAHVLPYVENLELRGQGGVRSRQDLEEAQRFVVSAGRSPIRVPATWLSQGYQSVIAWVADLVGQVFLEAGQSVDPAEMEGLVLVDEIDLHLHPRWQVSLIPALRSVFPRLQFVATTHSPMILPHLRAEEVIALTADEDGSVTAHPSTTSPMLMTGTDLYADFFGIAQLYPDELGADLDAYSKIAVDPTRTDADDERMRALRNRLAERGVELDADPVPRDPGGV